MTDLEIRANMIALRLTALRLSGVGGRISDEQFAALGFTQDEISEIDAHVDAYAQGRPLPELSASLKAIYEACWRHS